MAAREQECEMDAVISIFCLPHLSQDMCVCKVISVKVFCKLLHSIQICDYHYSYIFFLITNTIMLTFENANAESPKNKIEITLC